MATIPHALTSLALVKQFLGISTTANDALLENIINFVSDFIETACGKRRFLETTYSDELYDAPKGNKLFLKQYPITELTSLEYRTGTIASPTYVAFNANDYILYKKEGYIKFFYTQFFGFSEPEQFIKVDYKAGFLIDFTNINDPAQHTLPLDITLLANELVGQIFNSRASQGIKSESTEGQSVTYEDLSQNDLTQTQKQTIANYSQFRLTI